MSSSFASSILPSDQAHMQKWMQLALEQAAKALHVSDPNPRVGCILVNADNQCIGSGSTQAVGGPHAEIMALRDARSRGHSTQGATAYVTLEPCSHHGRTPPCADALVQAGISRVVIAAIDPNPRVCGHGIETLKRAGIQVSHGILAQQSRELNIGFFKRMQNQMPWVRLKAACSLDGKTALSNGSSQWITQEPARADGHTWRARASAVLTGIGTILADDPLLNVRAIQVEKQPWHVILDTRLRTPPSAAILKNPGQKLIYTASTDTHKINLLEQAGATVCTAPLEHGNTRLDLTWVLRDLAQRECNELHVEAGSALSSAFITNHLVDELLLYMAPRLLGQGRELVTGFMPETLDNTLDYQFHNISQVASDLRILLRPRPFST